jgi:pyridoxamine 5'-phosphate oxidase
LLESLAEVADRFGARVESDAVPRPAHWGGYALCAEHVELWASRRGRIHDRALWSRAGDPNGRRAGRWAVTRLQP